MIAALHGDLYTYKLNSVNIGMLTVTIAKTYETHKFHTKSIFHSICTFNISNTVGSIYTLN